MTDEPRSVGELIDTAVDALTDLAEAINEHPVGPGGRIDFSERLADILTHVTANVRGIDKLFITGKGEFEPCLRRLVQRRSTFENLISWRTVPIVARPFELNSGAAAELMPFTQRVAELKASYRAACERATRDGVTGEATDVDATRTNLAAAQQALWKAESAYKEELLEAMNICADDIGYTAPVIYAQRSEQSDPRDAQLIRHLEKIAMERISPPAREPDPQ